MSFSDREISTQDGRPVALYTLRWGQTYWRYTSSDRAIKRMEIVNNLMQEVTYEPRAISDSGMKQGTSAQNDLSIDGPGNLPIVALYRGTPPSESIILTVRRMHIGDADAPIFWKGVVLNVLRLDAARCQIIGKPMIATLKRTGLRLAWTRECPHYLYDSECRVNPGDFEVTAEVISTSGNLLTVEPSEVTDDGWFNGGYLEFEANDDGTTDRRFIESDVIFGEQRKLVIFGMADRIEVGMTLRMYPGCNRTTAMCQDKFNNLPNCGACEFMPGESPFVRPIW